MPKVSVIIATYNCEKYIKECIESILSQTFKDLEIIICDDASTDNTSEVLNEYSDDSRIRIIRNEKNMFAATARNRCIKIAKGKYVAIQDADDYSALDRLEKQVKFLEENSKYDFVGTGIHQFNDAGIWATGIKVKEPIKEDFLFATPFAHATLLIRKEVLLKINGYRISKETKRVEDYDMIMRMYAKGYIGYNLEEPLYYYRVDQNAVKRRKYKYRIDEAIVRYRCFKALDLFPRGYIYIIKPLVVGIIPYRVLVKLKGYIYRS